MGAQRRSGRVVAILIVAAVIGAAGVFAVKRVWFADAGKQKKIAGCAVDGECGAGRFCARGGCLPLLGSERAIDWHADLDALELSGAAWKPRAAYGEKLARAQACPAKIGKAELLDAGKIVLVHRAQVFEVLGDRIRIYVQNRMRGFQWLEAMRVSFPSVNKINLQKLCSSSSVSNVATVDRHPDAVDAALAQAAPAGAVASAALSYETDLPKADADGLRTLEIPLESAMGEAPIVTVVALPLGTHVARMSGPEPSRERLLTGFVAYYWKHGKTRGQVSISFTSRALPGLELALEEVKP
jgi:hypothetical protein